MHMPNPLPALKRTLSSFFPEESIEASKRKWNTLADENARYYIVSRKGEQIDESDFKAIGEENYRDLVRNDPLLREALGDVSHKRALNIGCGIGRLEEFFAQDFGEVCGIDISERMVARAKERLAHLPNVTFVATDGVTFPFPDHSFDLVFSYLVFQHMPSRAVVLKNLKEAHRVLRDGGIAKVQIRGGHQPYKWQWFHGPAFRKEEGIAIAKEAGFRVLKTDGENTKRFWLWLA